MQSNALSKRQQLTRSLVWPLFRDAFADEQCHARHAKTLQELLAREESAIVEVKRCLLQILGLFKRDAGVERAVDFVTAVICGAGSEALNATLEFLAFHTSCSDKAPRYRSCQLISRIMSGLDENTEIDEKQFVVLVDALVPRMHDKVPAVRAQAAAALRRLQEPENASDAPTLALRQAMRGDGSREVRSAALESLEPSLDTLPDLLRCAIDISPEVRVAAFGTLAAKVGPANLTAVQCAALAGRGLADRSEAAAKACRRMICWAWLRAAGGDPVELLGLFDPAQSSRHEEAAAKAANAVLSASLCLARRDAAAAAAAIGEDSDDESEDDSQEQERNLALRKAVDTEVVIAAAMTPQAALFARLRAEAVVADKQSPMEDREARREAALPEIAALCLHLESAVTVPELDCYPDALFVARQLLLLAASLDFAVDEGGRRRLVELISSLLLLSDLPELLVEPSVVALVAASPTETDFFATMAELVGETSDKALGKAPATANSSSPGDDGASDDGYATAAEDDVSGGGGAVSGGGSGGGGAADKSFTDANAPRVEEEISLEEEEEVRYGWRLRSLQLMSVALEKAKRSPTGGIASAFEHEILAAVQSQDEVFRGMGLMCLGKFCLLDPTKAAQHRALLLAVPANESLSVRAAALQALSDLSLVFGAGFVGSNGDLTGPLSAVVADRRLDRRLVAVAAETWAKLLFCGQVPATEATPALAALLLLYFEKGSAADPDTLAATLKAAAGGSGDNESDLGSDAGAEEEALEREEEIFNATALGSPMRLQQVLSTFFAAYAATGKDQRQQLLDAAQPALRLAREREAEENGDGGLVPVDKMVGFLSTLLSSHGDAGADAAATAGGAGGDEEGAGDKSDSESEEDEEEEEGDGGKSKKKKPAAKGKKAGGKTAASTATSAAAAAAAASLGLLAVSVCFELLHVAGGDGDAAAQAAGQQLVKALVALPPPAAEQDVVKLLRELVGMAQKCMVPKKGKGKARVVRGAAATAKMLERYAQLCLEADRTPGVPLPPERRCALCIRLNVDSAYCEVGKPAAEESHHNNEGARSPCASSCESDSDGEENDTPDKRLAAAKAVTPAVSTGPGGRPRRASAAKRASYQAEPQDSPVSSTASPQAAAAAAAASGGKQDGGGESSDAEAENEVSEAEEEDASSSSDGGESPSRRRSLRWRHPKSDGPKAAARKSPAASAPAGKKPAKRHLADIGNLVA